ncbi:MAG: TetR/AcrR family transcriptional regulator [Phenylobacterium sp.]|jgi:AcrR family transcriptional regulator
MEDLPTRDRLVFAAMKLFGEKGYLSTSVQDILREAGANAGSLYHAFPTKQDVLVAVLDLYRQGIEPMLLAPAWDGVDDPIEKIFALLASYRHALEISDCLYGCPIGSIALELHEPDPPVRHLLSVNFMQWVGHVERCLIEAGPRLPADLDRHMLAILVLNVMEGGVMQARTHRDLETFDASVAGLRDYITRLEKAATGSERTEAAGETP